jgi:hypothetical protein
MPQAQGEMTMTTMEQGLDMEALEAMVNRHGAVAVRNMLGAICRESATKLCFDLWDFIENVTDETPDRTERFFALRERVRNLQA